jgi:hypothetical protein
MKVKTKTSSLILEDLRKSARGWSPFSLALSALVFFFDLKGR